MGSQLIAALKDVSLSIEKNEYVALMGQLEDIDPSSKEGQDISSALGGLDKLCAK